MADPALAACALWEATIDEIGEPLPAVEVGLRWLRLNPPPPPPRECLVHGDFRLGNLIVDESGLAAVIDWELCHSGDPAEDIGWVCVRSWRFGNDDLPVAGVGALDELLAAYEAAGGEPPSIGADPVVGGDGQRQVGGDLRPPGARSPDRIAAVGGACVARKANQRTRMGSAGITAGCLLRFASGGTRSEQGRRA